ncbi:hypothetical protein TWF103_010732 [Orbilia oligospora]|nr:hypothetical protein TWF103_010732 [Orbilia oligospora]
MRSIYPWRLELASHDLHVPEIHGENPFDDDEEGDTNRKQRRDNLWHPKDTVSLGGVEPPIKGVGNSSISSPVNALKGLRVNLALNK